VDWDLKSGLHACKADAAPLEPLCFASVILEMGFEELFPWLASNHDSPKLSLPSS
jgi:hypothetical protein